MALPVHNLMTVLANRRPLFHSEADFQHELAWEIRLSNPTADIRLERPVSIGRRRMEIDMFVTLGSLRIALELKYKTKAGNATLAGEQFALAQHAATPLGRYDFWRDVERLECLRKGCVADEAWTIFLTNDPGYWSTRPARGNGEAFSLHDARRVDAAILSWKNTGNTASIGAARVSDISIRGAYVLQWHDYSGKPLRFRFLAIKQP